MTRQPISFADQLSKITDLWAPRVVAEVNDNQVKLVRIRGEFVWHAHSETDEAFIVLEGEMAIELRDGRVALTAGEMYVVPAGIEHRPVAPRECRIMLIEPRGVVNTGDGGTDPNGSEGDRPQAAVD